MKRVVIVGAGGRLGAALVREYSQAAGDRAAMTVTGFNHAQMDLAAPEEMRRTLGELEFDVLVNCAAQTNVDRCETHRDEAFALNAAAPEVLAQICTERGAKLVHISTDYVFDGVKREPYTEDEPARPLSVYGASKLAGEERVLAADGNHVVARVSWVFGPDRPSFVDALIKRARNEETVDAIGDKWSTPSYTIDLAPLLCRLMEPDAAGVFHLTNTGECTWQEYAQWAIDCCVENGVPMKGRVVAASRLADMKNFIARRPVYTVLSTAKFSALAGATPRPWRDAVADYVRTHVSRA